MQKLYRHVSSHPPPHPLPPLLPLPPPLPSLFRAEDNDDEDERLLRRSMPVAMSRTARAVAAACAGVRAAEVKSSTKWMKEEDAKRPVEDEADKDDDDEEEDDDSNR